jgi:uncharacterized membrane-anchored protein
MTPMVNLLPSIAPFVEAVVAVTALVAGLSFFFTAKRMLCALLWLLLAAAGVGLWLHAIWALPL